MELFAEIWEAFVGGWQSLRNLKQRIAFCLGTVVVVLVLPFVWVVMVSMLALLDWLDA